MLAFLFCFLLSPAASGAKPTGDSSSSSADESSSASSNETSEASENTAPKSSTNDKPSSGTSDQKESKETASQTEAASTNDTTVPEPTQDNPEIDLSQAEPLENLTEKTIRWLKPTRGKLPQNPYQHIDFTAYTLEWGEMQLGLNSAIGIAPRTQIGSQLILNAIGIYNGNAKINLIRLDRLDLAITGTYLTVPGDPDVSGDLSIDYYGAGLYSSLQLLENRAWSIHAGAQANRLSIDGFPTFSGLNSVLTAVTGLEEAKLQEIQTQITDVADYENQSDILTVTLATDYRLNRRDSFILQGSGFFAQNNGLGLQVKYEDTDIPLPEMTSELFRFLLFPNPTEQQFSTSLSYQATFKSSYLRIGIGWSTIPYQWMTNSLEYAWRFGGSTKRTEKKMQDMYELNKKVLKDGADKR